MNNPEKMKSIVKIQSVYRGGRDRERVRGLRDQRGTSMMGKMGASPDGATNYENQEVIVSS